jgi:phosphate transport system protein
MRTRFDEQLTSLNKSLIKMATRVEESLEDAVKALKTQDKALAKKIVASDDEIDRMERKIERKCLTIILQQQPVARDLRLVTSVLKMTTDLERIGDHATDISNIAVMLADKPYVKELDHIPQMAKAAMKMIIGSIKAFVEKDEGLAQTVISDDEEVNRLFAEVKAEIVDIINKGTSEGAQLIELTMIAKYFERIGDHATNIAEWVIFTLTGVHKDKKIM